MPNFNTTVPQNPYEFLTEYGDGLRSMVTIKSDYGDGVTDCTDQLKGAFLTSERTGVPCRIARGEGPGIYCYEGKLTLPPTLYCDPGVILRTTAKNDGRLWMRSNSVISGGEYQNWTMRRYRISAIAQPGGANTAVTITLLQDDLDELGAHDYTPGEELMNVGIISTAGTWNAQDLTVTGVTASTVTFAARTATINTSTVYPYERLDGQGRSIYPICYRSRTDFQNDCIVMLIEQAHNWEIRNCTFRWSPCGAIFAWGQSYGGRIIGNKIYDTAADSISISQGAHDILIAGNVIEGAGDDSIALLGARVDGRVANIQVRGNTIRNSYFGGRGISLVGTHNCQVMYNNIEDVYHAGIYISKETNFYGNTKFFVFGNTLKTTGNSNATSPDGWDAQVYAAINVLGASDSDMHSGEICHNTILNSRYTALALIRSASHVYVHHNDIEEADGSGVAPLLMYNGQFDSNRINRVWTNGISPGTSGAVGQNTWFQNFIANPNRGKRTFLKSISVDAVSTITAIMEPNQSQSSTYTSSSAVRFDWVASIGSTDAQTAKDLAINGAWTLASYTASSTGDIVTVTSSGLASTQTATTRCTAQTCPHAYMTFQAGDDSSNDGVLLDSDNLGSKLWIDRTRFGELNWPMQRTFDNSGGSTNWWLLTLQNTSIDSAESVNGNNSMQYMNWAHAQGATVTNAVGTTMAMDYIRRSVYPRSSQTSNVVDTFPTAAQIVASLAANGVPGFTLTVKNYHTSFTWTGAVSTGITSSGSLTAATSHALCVTVGITNRTPGSEAVTITRIDTYAIET